VRRSSVLCVIVLLASCARTPPIRGENGAVMADSIAVMEEIELGGIRQWIVIRGKDTASPLLLWLAGGPGGSEIGWTRKYLSELENDVVFVNWEQPGSGKSAGGADIKTLTVDDFVDQTILLSEYLCTRFDREAIFLVGHSWGSIIGLKAVERRPDLYYAYIGVGQQVNSVENDRIGYELVLEGAWRAGEDATVKELEAQGPPPYGIEEGHPYFKLFRRLARYSPAPPDSYEADFMSFIHPQEYTIFDSVRMIRSVADGVNYVYPQLSGLDFETQIPRVEIPVFLVTGRYDFTCVQDIAYRYYKKLQAPAKSFYWFEHSGHNACYQEPDRFVRLMRRDVLPLATVR